MRNERLILRLIMSVLALVVGMIVKRGKVGGGSKSEAGDEARVMKAARDRESGFLVLLDGEVFKSLPDDTQGDEHQRFLMRLSGGHTLLVAHNTDLAHRIPIREGDRVRVRGQYEWNERGGVVHWTHLDPGRRREGGWVMLDGKKYQ